MAQKIEQAKIEAVRKKVEYEAAQKVVDEFADKKNRDQIRAQKRRDEIVGHVFSAVCATSPDTWAEYEPHLAQWLEEAGDSDRVLFGLHKKQVEVSKTDTEEGSKAAASTDTRHTDPVLDPTAAPAPKTDAGADQGHRGSGA